MFTNPLVLADEVPANHNLTIQKTMANGSVRTNLTAAASANENLAFRHTMDSTKAKQRNRHNAHFELTDFDAVTGEPYVTTLDITVGRHKKAPENTAVRLLAEGKSLLGIASFGTTLLRGGY